MSLQSIAPTVIDPLAALSENKDWTGKPDQAHDVQRGSSRIQERQGYRYAWSKLIAEGLNYLTGGTGTN